MLKVSMAFKNFNAHIVLSVLSQSTCLAIYSKNIKNRISNNHSPTITSLQVTTFFIILPIDF